MSTKIVAVELKKSSIITLPSSTFSSSVTQEFTPVDTQLATISSVQSITSLSQMANTKSIEDSAKSMPISSDKHNGPENDEEYDDSDEYGDELSPLNKSGMS